MQGIEGLTKRQRQVWGFILTQSLKGPLLTKAIAEHFLISYTAASDHLLRLERKGLIVMKEGKSGYTGKAIVPASARVGDVNVLLAECFALLGRIAVSQHDKADVVAMRVKIANMAGLPYEPPEAI